MSNQKILTKMRKLSKETVFVGFLGKWLSEEFPEEQRLELDQLFGLQSGKFVADCNRYMERTAKAVEKGLLSLEGFSPLHEEIFRRLLNSSRLDRELQRRLRDAIQKKLDELNSKGNNPS